MAILQAFLRLFHRLLLWTCGLVVILFFISRFFKTDFGLWVGPVGSRTFEYAPENWQDLLLWLFILGGMALVAYLIDKAISNVGWFKTHPGKAPFVILGVVAVLALVGYKIIDYGNSLAAENNEGKLLNAIAVSSSPEVIVDLIKQVDQPGPSMSYNAFETALIANDLAIIRVLVEHDFNINAQARALYKGSGSGETVLMRAAYSFSPEAVKVLLANGADVKMKNSSNQTALHYALTGLQEGQLEKVKILLAAGADPDAKDHDGNSARDLVAKNFQYAPGLPEYYKELSNLVKK